MQTVTSHRNALSHKVAAFIRGESGQLSSEEAFNRLALELFAFQYEAIDAYRRLCSRQGRTPQTVHFWWDIPAVPAASFKHFFLFAGDPSDVACVFRSSGTGSREHCSEAAFSQEGLQLMNTAIRTNAARHLFANGRRMRILVGAPSPEQAPNMIMAYGMDQILRHFGLPDSQFFGSRAALNVRLLLSALQECQEENRPVTLMGSSFGLVHLFDEMTELGVQLHLPIGSQLVDAGGYKGRSREIDRYAFQQYASSRLGLSPAYMVNLLGMTEMASQVYDEPVEAARSRLTSGPHVRCKRSPPWVRTQVIDLTNLRRGRPSVVMHPGGQGLLCHFDLANVERPLAVQTEDIGIYQEAIDFDSEKDRTYCCFEILGRIATAQPKGCSLTADLLTGQSPERT